MTTATHGQPPAAHHQTVKPPDADALDRLLHRGTAEVIREADLARLLQTTDRPLRIKSRHRSQLGRSPPRPHRLLPQAPPVPAAWAHHRHHHRRLDGPDRRPDRPLGRPPHAQRGRRSGRTPRPTPTSCSASWTARTSRSAGRASGSDSFTLEHVFRLTARATVAQLLAREDFRTRFEAGQPLAVVELLYPLLQAQDSVEVRADVELGGTRPEVQPPARPRSPGRPGPAAAAACHGAAAGRHRRRPEDEQEPRQRHPDRRRAGRDVRQGDVAAR